MKEFVDANYKKPYKFNSNLYSVFLRRCYEYVSENGKIAMIHPLTFMFIKTFEEVRKFILDKTHILLFVDYGPDSTNVFDGSFASAPAMYILEKQKKQSDPSLFISLNKYTRTPYEKFKKEYFLKSLEDYIFNKANIHNYILLQDKLKIIKGSPFIYWLSDEFRDKFIGDSIKIVCPPKSGLATSDNERFLRYWWEVDNNNISKNNDDNKTWKYYAKGGNHNKWFGNLWLCVNWKDNASEMRKTGKAVFRNEDYYFKEGITYSALGPGSFRLLPENSVYDVGGASLFPISNNKLQYFLGLLNSKFSKYVISCLNPTVNTQVGDIERIPFVKPIKLLEDNISALANQNVEIKRHINTFKLVEPNYSKNPILFYNNVTLKDRLTSYINFENSCLTLLLLNEAVIDKYIYEVYELMEYDQLQIISKLGRSIGELPIIDEARNAYLQELNIEDNSTREYLLTLDTIEYDEQHIQNVRNEFPALYQNNNDFEEFCIRFQTNPINVWYWLKECKILPKARSTEIILEFFIDAFRTILMEDEDGIVPLLGLSGEPKLIDRLEKYCIENGFTTALYMQLDDIVCRPISDYIEHYFFIDLCEHLNLFMYQPKTPFIWHLSSGENKGFEAFIIIYKWNRDSLYKLKSTYITKRAESLQYKLDGLKDNNSAAAQEEKELIQLQLIEIEKFVKKIDELISEGYDPKLDDGVGKNIAPLQKKGMLKADVLNKKQLEKYLIADW